MDIIRGTTPTITVKVKTELDLHQVSEVWLYISQGNKVKVDKKLDDCEFDYENRWIITTLSQDDTLGLKAGEALFQIRLLLNNNTALAMIARDIEIAEVYKNGVIKPEEETQNG